MLTRTRTRIGSLTAAVCIALIGFWGAAAPAALADTTCGPNEVAVTIPGGVTCVAKTTTGGTGGGNTANGGTCDNSSASVTENGTTYPCLLVINGIRWNFLENSGGCYDHTDPNPPPLTDPIWNGHLGDNGTIVLRSCSSPPSLANATRFWERCTTACVVLTPQQLESRLSMVSPTPVMSPPSGTTGLVKQNVWFWTPTDMDDHTVDASQNGATITLSRTLISVNWNIVDSQGTIIKTLHCRSNHPWSADQAGKPSPDPECGFQFPKASAYTITVQAFWSYTAIINGVTTTLPINGAINQATITIIEGQSTNG
jgi:hypothetical protein